MENVDLQFWRDEFRFWETPKHFSAVVYSFFLGILAEMPVR
ncbi:hypothetical protein PJE062_3848 [Pseudovibrio sp. JE062]|nr:hypothetical protein PJE062_3848 [Pseudovibrio sp. JE062]